MANSTTTSAAELRRVLDFAADALDMIDLKCNNAPEGKRCEECGSCAGFFALQRAREVLAKESEGEVTA